MPKASQPAVKIKTYGHQIQSEEARREKTRRQENDRCQEEVAVRLLLPLLTESGEADSFPNHRVAVAAPGSSSVAHETVPRPGLEARPAIHPHRPARTARSGIQSHDQPPHQGR